MRLRRSLIVLLSAFALVAATVGAALAAPPAQTADDGVSDPTSTEAEATRPAKAYLGLVVRKLNDHQREALGLPENLEGAVVVRAAKGSPADTAGLQRGDVILRANGADVASPKDLKEVIDGMEPGDKLTIVYYRDGRDRVTVTLGERPHRDGSGGGSRLKNPFQRFLNILPRAVDGSFRALDDDGNVHVYEFAQGSLIETGESAIAIEKATGETAKFEIGESTTIIKKGHEVELSDLEEGDRVVVLMVDGEVKALVVGPHRRPQPVTRVRPVGPRDADTSMPPEVHERLRELRERIGDRGGRDFGPRIERLEKRVDALREGLHELVRRLQAQHQQQPEPGPGPEVTAA